LRFAGLIPLRRFGHPEPTHPSIQLGNSFLFIYAIFCTYSLFRRDAEAEELKKKAAPSGFSAIVQSVLFGS
jgi:hypothetical protein